MDAKERALETIASITSTGQDFFEAAIRALSAGLGCRWGGVGILIADEKRIQVIAYCDAGDMRAPFIYDLAESPCLQAYENSGQNLHILIPDDLANKFPNDPHLEEKQARSYRAEIFRGSNGEPLGHVFLINDKPMPDDPRDRAFFRLISQRIGAEVNRDLSETQLRENQVLLNTIIDNIPIPINLLDLEGRYLMINQRFVDWYGVSAEEIIGRTAGEVLDLDDDQLAARQNQEQQIISSGKASTRESVKILTDGTDRRTLVTKFPVFDRAGNVTAIGTASTDVSKLKQSEDALAEQRDLLQALVDNIPEMVCLKDTTGRYILVNRQFEEWVAVDREDALGKTPEELMPEQGQEFADLSERALSTGEPVNLDREMTHPDGVTRTVVSKRFPVTSRTGETLGTGLVSSDISDRKATEQALEEQKDLMQALIDNLPDLVALKDVDGRLLLVNQQFETWLGKTREQAIGKTIRELFNSADADEFEIVEKQVLASGEPLTREREFQFPDGKTRAVVSIRFPVRSKDSEIIGLGLVNTDITERKAAERAVAEHRDKLEEIVDERTRELKIAEAEAREKSSRLEMVFDASDQGFCIWDESANLVMHNPRYAEIMEFPEELLRKETSLYDRTYFLAERGVYGPGDPKDLAEARVAEVLKEFEQGTPRDHIMTTHTGRVIRVRRRWITDVGSISCVNDITDIVETDRVNTLLRGAIDEFPESVILYDENERVRFTNDRYHRIFPHLPGKEGILALSQRDVLERTAGLAEKYHFESQGGPGSWVSERIETRQSQESYMREMQINGQTFLISFKKVPKVGSIISHTDITELKRVQTELAEHRDSLEETVDERTRDLMAAKERSELANRAKTEFLDNMSHELRTPLNAIIGFSQMMTTEIFGPIENSHYKDYAGDIFGSASYLLELINDILDVSRIEAGRLELEETPVDLAEIISSSVHLVAEHAASAGLELETEINGDLPSFMGDPRRIKQILINLLFNAIKFTPAGGTIRTGVSREAASGITLFVQDNGVGISEGDIPKIIEPFSTIESSYTRSHDGIGLGLSIVKSLTELHGGSVEIESAKGTGTMVRIIMPASRIIPDTSN